MTPPPTDPHRIREAWGRALLDDPSLVAVSTDDRGTIREVNRGALLLLGYEREELVETKNLTTLHDPNELRERAQDLTQELGRPIEPGLETLVAAMGDGAPAWQEWCYLRKDGTKLPMLLSVTASRDPARRRTGFLSIGRDLRERRRVENQLAEAEARFRSLSEAAFEGISISEDGVIAQCNRQLATMFGYRHDELVGMSVAELVVPEHRELVRARSRAATTCRTGSKGCGRTARASTRRFGDARCASDTARRG